MVSSVNSINHYKVNYEELEVMRRLQSLGIRPSGNLAFDRQTLQTAEIEKKRTTLATNSEVNLNRIEGTNSDFSTTFRAVGLVNKSDSTAIDQGNGFGLAQISDANSVSNSQLQYSMVGANQIAELNKYKLGLIA